MGEKYAMPFDESDMEAAAPPTAEELASIAELLSKLREAKANALNKKTELDLANEAVRLLEEDSLPKALVAARTKKFIAEDGTTVELKEGIYAGIKKENAAAAFAWLRENGHGDLIKRNITIAFDRGQEDQAAILLQLIENSIEYKDVDDSTSVHTGTLGAFVREQLATGKTVDEVLLGVYRRRFVDVKEPKAPKKF